MKCHFPDAKYKQLGTGHSYQQMAHAGVPDDASEAQASLLACDPNHPHLEITNSSASGYMVKPTLIELKQRLIDTGAVLLFVPHKQRDDLPRGSSIPCTYRPSQDELMRHLVNKRTYQSTANRRILLSTAWHLRRTIHLG